MKKERKSNRSSFSDQLDRRRQVNNRLQKEIIHNPSRASNEMPFPGRQPQVFVLSSCFSGKDFEIACVVDNTNIYFVY
jgi:hypothetical protein